MVHRLEFAFLVEVLACLAFGLVRGDDLASNLSLSTVGFYQ